MIRTRELYARILAGVAVILLTAQPVSAADSKDDGFDYPELQVTPLASERIDMESAREDDSRWTRHIPIQLSALSTTLLGFRVMGVDSNGSFDNSSSKGLPAVLVGVGWLATTTYLAMSYRPYASASADIRERHKGKGRRDILVRERVAEEHLEAIARTGRTLSWLSLATNLAATAFASTGVDTDIGTAMAVGAGLFAFTPIVFRYDWQRIASQQEEYKKRIFGTFAYQGAALGFVPDSDSGNLVPALNLSFAF